MEFSPRCNVNLEITNGDETLRTYNLTFARIGWEGASTVTDVNSGEEVKAKYYSSIVFEHSSYHQNTYSLVRNVRLSQEISLTSNYYNYGIDLQGTYYEEFQDVFLHRSITFLKNAKDANSSEFKYLTPLKNSSTLVIDIKKISDESFNYVVQCYRN